MGTKIEWTNETWNLITGCSHASEGCQNCYAEKMHKRLNAMGLNKYAHDFNTIRFHESELDKDFGKKPKMIFVNSMSDTFHKNIDDLTIDSILHACAERSQHIFQILTKRAERLSDFYYPKNVWLGVTVEKAKYKKRINFLKQTNAKVKFLSCEPLLEDLGELDLKGIDWVICGGESGRNARPCNPLWVWEIQQQCQKQCVPFFFKQWGEYQPYYVLNKTQEVGTSEVNNSNLEVHYKRTGKKESGALLFGKEYKEFPKIMEEK
jgi:protein gp37